MFPEGVITSPGTLRLQAPAQQEHYVPLVASAKRERAPEGLCSRSFCLSTDLFSGQRSADESFEQRVRTVRAAFELRMELHSDVEGPARQLRRFDQVVIR